MKNALVWSPLHCFTSFIHYVYNFPKKMDIKITFYCWGRSMELWYQIKQKCYFYSIIISFYALMNTIVSGWKQQSWLFFRPNGWSPNDRSFDGNVHRRTHRNVGRGQDRRLLGRHGLHPRLHGRECGQRAPGLPRIYW